MVDHLRDFTRELESRTAQPERLALHIGGLIEPDLDVNYYLAGLDAMADEAEDRQLPGLRGAPDVHRPVPRPPATAWDRRGWRPGPVLRRSAQSWVRR